MERELKHKQISKHLVLKHSNAKRRDRLYEIVIVSFRFSDFENFKLTFFSEVI